MSAADTVNIRVSSPVVFYNNHTHINHYHWAANRANRTNGSLYYVNARRNLVEPLPLRDFSKVVKTAIILERMPYKSKAREVKSQKSGVIGLSVFYPLTLLYDYNYLHNALADGMHNPTNEGKMFANYFNAGGKSGTAINPCEYKAPNETKGTKKGTQVIFEDEGDDNDDDDDDSDDDDIEDEEDEEFTIQNRLPVPPAPVLPPGVDPGKNGGRETFVDFDLMKIKMGRFPAPHELRDSRWPTAKTMTESLGYWKCERIWILKPAT